MKPQNIISYKLEFDQVYREHFGRLYAFASSLIKCEEIAKDVISDVFVNLWNTRIDFSKIRDIEAYLFIAVKNQALQALSKSPHGIGSMDIENALRRIDMSDPEHVLIEKELLNDLEAAVKSLPDQCQLVFALARDKNMTYQQISDELGIAHATVKSHMIKAIANIRVFITEKYSDEKLPAAVNA
ncbi:MAG: RNA polymerase sigma-70 factor [Cyclobacteriaceae bacterium]|nr:RNA polymerase sigma-70 factor [Cyclobacteriaceae bacterium SS2]